MENYESKLIPVSIKFASRTSIKIRDNFYTVEAEEERIAPEGVTDINWDAEKKMLWDSVNNEVDDQIEDIKNWVKDNKE